MKKWDIDYLTKWLNKISLAKKFIILFFCSIMIPLCVLNYTYFAQTENNVQQEMIDKLNEVIDEKQAKIQGALSGAISLSRTYCKNELLYDYLDNDYTDNLAYFIQYQERIQSLFANSQNYYMQIKQSRVYTDNPTTFNGKYVGVLEDFQIDKLGENLIDLSLYELNGENSKHYLRIAREDKNYTWAEDRNVSIVSVMNYFSQYKQYNKVLRLDLDITYFVNLLVGSNMFENILLVDQDNRIIASANQYDFSGEYALFHEDEYEKGMVVLSREIEGFPMTLYGLYDSNRIASEFRRSLSQTWMIALVCLLIALCFVLIFASNITKRTNLLVKQSREIAKGNFIQMYIEEGGTDEISILETSINQMSEQLQTYIEKEYKDEIERVKLEQETTQAKLLALQSQVNPHFMFNALESIRLKAMTKGEEETARMIKYMSKMFRNLITWDNSIITLKEEITFLDEFLHIQNYRFEDEFSYEVNVTEEAMKCYVPKMIIQPLVENACIHGVEAIESNRFVSVKADIQGGNLALIVSDNGGGMSSERLKNLEEEMKNNIDNGISVGLKNVYRRLLLYYGEKFTFQIFSQLGKGTICEIKIPVDFSGGKHV